MHKILNLTLIIGAVACGGGGAAVRPAASSPPASAGTGTPTTAGAASASAPAAGDPFALPPRPSENELFTLVDRDDAPVDVSAVRNAWRTKGVAARPAACAAYASRPPAKPAPSSFAAALAERDPARRDAMLVALQAKAPTLVAALRADLAPVECADAVTDAHVPASGAVTGKAANVLVGLSLAAKLARTALAPPKMEDTTDKAKVKAFIKGPLAKWVVEQATAIESLGSAAVGLRGYGRGLAAVEAGVADLRLVDQIRSAPTPKGWDAELKAVYEAALDEALEPRKARGRDAALVGLADLAQVGVLDDASVARARALLGKLYGGRRIDALDALLLPPRGPAPSDVPAYWAAAAPELGAKTEGVVGRAACTGASCLDYARMRFEMGRTYWRRADFVEAAYAAKEAGSDPSARLLLALAVTLAHGPNGAKEMMSAPSPSALGLDRTAALDAVAADGGPTGAMAAFDAAHLRSLSVPEGAAAGPWLRDVAARFRKSASLLDDAQKKALAERRADDADAAATATEKR